MSQPPDKEIVELSKSLVKISKNLDSNKKSVLNLDFPKMLYSVLKKICSKNIQLAFFPLIELCGPTNVNKQDEYLQRIFVEKIPITIQNLSKLESKQNKEIANIINCLSNILLKIYTAQLQINKDVCGLTKSISEFDQMVKLAPKSFNRSWITSLSTKWARILGFVEICSVFDQRCHSLSNAFSKKDLSDTISRFIDLSKSNNLDVRALKSLIGDLGNINFFIFGALGNSEGQKSERTNELLNLLADILSRLIDILESWI